MHRDHMNDLIWLMTLITDHHWMLYSSIITDLKLNSLKAMRWITVSKRCVPLAIIYSFLSSIECVIFIDSALFIVFQPWLAYPHLLLGSRPSRPIYPNCELSAPRSAYPSWCCCSRTAPMVSAPDFMCGSGPAHGIAIAAYRCSP